MIVEFTKELKGIQKIPTKQWSFLVSFVLLVLVHIANRTFHIIDLVLYALTAISISLGSNGLSDYNKKVEEKKNSNQVQFQQINYLKCGIVSIRVVVV